MVKTNLRLFVVLGFLSLFFSDVIAVELGDYDSPAQNAVTVVYGKSKDGETYMLFAHDKRGFWTPPGGARCAGQTILGTASNELYEETGAFDLFNPNKTKPLLKKQSAESVFKYGGGGRTELFALNIGSEIDKCKTIGLNYTARVKGKKGCFREMDAWKVVNVKKLFTSLDAHASTVLNGDVALNHVGTLRHYVFNSLWSFYKRGALKNVMQTSIDLMDQRNAQAAARKKIADEQRRKQKLAAQRKVALRLKQARPMINRVGTLNVFIGKISRAEKIRQTTLLWQYIINNSTKGTTFAALKNAMIRVQTFGRGTFSKGFFLYKKRRAV